MTRRLPTRRDLTRDIALFALAMPSLAWAQAASADPLATRLRAGACAVLWRHAQTTPGVGDPPGFRLDSCGTQRNLSEQGRLQARAAGDWFQAQKLTPRLVRSSAWCRCKDTADLAFGRHEVWLPLNSTFGERAESANGRQAMIAALRTIPAGAFEVWVTHQVNITTLTNEVPSMGEALLVDAAAKVVGRGVFRS